MPSTVFPNYRVVWTCQCGASGVVEIRNDGAPPGTTPVYGAFAAAIQAHRKDPRQCILKGSPRPKQSITVTSLEIKVHIGERP